MTNIDLMQRWHQDLAHIASEHDLENDREVNEQLSLIAIELESMHIRLPEYNLSILNVTDQMDQVLHQLHTQRIAERCLALLQTIVGYYALPEQPKGQNEPIIGSFMAHELKTSLISNEIDLYAVKETLSELIESSTREQK